MTIFRKNKAAKCSAYFEVIAKMFFFFMVFIFFTMYIPQNLRVTERIVKNSRTGINIANLGYLVAVSGLFVQF